MYALHRAFWILSVHRRYGPARGRRPGRRFSRAAADVENAALVVLERATQPGKDRRAHGSCLDAGYYGFGILATNKMGLEFMSPAYLDRYQEAVDQAERLGMKMCLYDEFWFPSGSAGGLLARQHPEALGKRLDMTLLEAVGPKSLTRRLPAGRLMAAVAMHALDLRRSTWPAQVHDGRLTWNVPDGPWKIMLFTCVPDGARGLVDYLDADSVRRFIELTYEAYYNKFPRHFGKTIDSAFYDEPTMHWIQGGRAWTPAFNEKFRRRHGCDPALLYPALVVRHRPRDRRRAQRPVRHSVPSCIAEGYVKTLADWCTPHGVALDRPHGPGGDRQPGRPLRRPDQVASSISTSRASTRSSSLRPGVEARTRSSARRPPTTAARG